MHSHCLICGSDLFENWSGPGTLYLELPSFHLLLKPMTLKVDMSDCCLGLE